MKILENSKIMNIQKQKVYLTEAKYQALKKQLDYMENEGDKKLAALLAESPGSGMGRPLDLPVHDVSRKFYAELDEIRKKLYYAEIIEDLVEAQADKNTAGLGSWVDLLNVEDNEMESFLILGPDEADPLNGIISYLSPLGKIICGKKENDSFTMESSGEKFCVKAIRYQPLGLAYEPRDWDKKLESLNVK